MMKKTNKQVTGILSLIAFLALPLLAAAIESTDIDADKLQVPLNKSKLITLGRTISEISQGNPSVADFPVNTEAAETSFIPPNQLLVRGKSLGTTNLILWDGKGRVINMLDIEVTHDLESLKAKLHEVLPNEKIDVRSSQKNIILSGEASSPITMQAAIDVAQGYLGTSQTIGSSGATNGNSSGSGNINVSTTNATPQVDPSKGATPMVINLMNVGGAQQVMLDVKVAEIDRRLIKGLNVKFSALQTSSNFSIGAINGGGTISPSGLGSALNSHSFDAAALFLQAISGEFLFNLTIDAANDNQLAKILAQPTLTALSGQEANFFSGGEFPVPIPQGGINNGSITVQFKKFGIELKFVPLVLDSGRINLNMNVAVSELSEDAIVRSAVTGTNTVLVIPSLTKREASSTLELSDGQTISIAGLISDRLRESINKFPGLGDVPVLGALFRSSQFQNQQTELVIFVTPHLAKPVLANQARLPTDSFVAPDDIDFYILGRTESRNARKVLARQNALSLGNKGGLDGSYGQQLMEGGSNVKPR